MSQRHSDAALLDAARACVAERGIARTTVADVARRAGASRMTVYRAFPDASALWSSLLTREVGMIVADAEARPPRFPPPASDSSPPPPPLSWRCAATPCSAG